MLKSDSIRKVENHLERWEGFYMQNYAAKQKTRCFLRTTWAWNVAPRQRTYLACSRSRPSSRKQQQSHTQTTIVGEEAVVMPKRPSCGLSGEITDGQEEGREPRSSVGCGCGARLAGAPGTESGSSPLPSLQKGLPHQFCSVFPNSQAQHLPLLD